MMIRVCIEHTPDGTLPYSAEVKHDGRCVWDAGGATPIEALFNLSRTLAEELQEVTAEDDATNELRQRAYLRAAERWQKATGKTLTWPDTADLIVWLCEKIDKGEEP